MDGNIYMKLSARLERKKRFEAKSFWIQIFDFYHVVSTVGVYFFQILLVQTSLISFTDSLQNNIKSKRRNFFFLLNVSISEEQFPSKIFKQKNELLETI